MRPALQSTTIRFAAAAATGILSLGLVSAPPSVAVPRTEVHAVQLASAGTVTPAAVPTPRPAAASPAADDSTAPPDFLAFAASILEYLNSLGLGPGPGLAAIGLSGLVVAFAATAYVWNGFADTVNPGLRVLHLPRVPKFPVCFAGQSCAGSSSAQARLKAANRVVPQPNRATGRTGRSTASSGRSVSTPTAVKADVKKSTSSSGKGSSKRVRRAPTH